jgi:glycerophosphoryl diester phosphodiesterase
MNRRFHLASVLISTPLAAVLVMFAGSGAQAAGACGSTALAHRGFVSATIDENTVESIERAHEVDAYTENDVFLTADGRFLIIHNLSLRHTTNCEGDVTDWLMADIQRQCHTTPNGQALPTALRAFRTLAGNPGQVMNVEVKGPGWFANDNASLVALTDAATRAGVLNRVYFSNDATYRLLTELRDSVPDANAAWKPDTAEPDLSVEHATELSAEVVMARAGQWARNRGLATEMKDAGIAPWAKVIDDKVVWENNWERGIEVQLTNRSKGYLAWCDSVA